MTNNIQFPELGLNFTVNTTAITIGSFSIQWYGIIIAIGFLCAIAYGFKCCSKMNINKDGLFDAILVGLVCGIIGARLYYVIFFPGDKYINNPIEIFSIKEGGMGIYGGIIGGLLGGAIVAKFRKIKVAAVLDVSVLGYLIGQAIGRWGNFINQEAFGTATTLPWGMKSNVTELTVVGNVHPCFLYESLLCILGFFLLHLFTRYLRRYDGQTFLLYIVWYGASRFFIEGLRTDSLLIGGLDIRISQAVAAVSVIFAIVMLVVFARKTSLTGCGSKKIMELNAIVLGQDGTKKKDEVLPQESTIFAGQKYTNETETVMVDKVLGETADVPEEASDEKLEEIAEKTLDEAQEKIIEEPKIEDIKEKSTEEGE